MNKEISKGIEMLMVATAAFFDLLQFGVNFIPVVGQFISVLITIFGWLTFFLWFKFYNLSIIKTGNIVFGFLEFIPILNDLPMFIALVLRTLSVHHKDQLLKNIPGAQIANAVMDRRIKSQKFRDVSVNQNMNVKTRGQQEV